ISTVGLRACTSVNGSSDGKGMVVLHVLGGGGGGARRELRSGGLWERLLAEGLDMDAGMVRQTALGIFGGYRVFIKAYWSIDGYENLDREEEFVYDGKPEKVPWMERAGAAMSNYRV
ncbi:hypothetical protein SERLADRAFT_397648, partial [Serpula lacrymans var. lacrymans S7.9]